MTEEVRVILPPTTQRPCEVRLVWWRNSGADAIGLQLVVPSNTDAGSLEILRAREEAEALLLEYGMGGEYKLRFGRFDVMLSAEQAAELERAFRPLGLSVRRADSDAARSKLLSEAHHDAREVVKSVAEQRAKPTGKTAMLRSQMLGWRARALIAEEALGWTDLAQPE